MNSIIVPGVFCGRCVYQHYVGHRGVSILEQSPSDSFEHRVEKLKRIVRSHPDIELVGHSAGAHVVLRVAHDMQVARATLIAPVPMPGCWLPINVNIALTSYLRFKSSAISDKHAGKYFFNIASRDNIHFLVDESYKVIWKLAWHQLAWHIRDHFIPKVSTSIRVLGGNLDASTPLASVAKTARILGVKVEPLHGFGHMPFLEDRHFADKFNLWPRVTSHV